MTTIKRKGLFDGDPYDLCYDEAAGMFTEEELEVRTVDFSKRNWRKKI